MRLDPHLRARKANFSPLTPLSLLERSVELFPERPAVIWGETQLTYTTLAGVVAHFADWLSKAGVGPGDVVSMICGNRPEMLAAHFAVPMLGATLNCVNTRLDAASVAYVLDHSETRLLIAAPDCVETAEAAARQTGTRLATLSPDGRQAGLGLSLLNAGPVRSLDLTARISDEWLPIALNYTSGTTGHPKGVVLHHRGAYLNALGNILTLGLGKESVYLWTLPMFHCNGWCHSWAVTGAGGTHVCLDKVDPALIFRSIADHGVTHMACAPVVLHMLLNDPARANRDPSQRLKVATGGAAPTAGLIARMEEMGFDFLHLYGLTESFGPVTLRELGGPEQNGDSDAKASLLARQGFRHLTANRVHVLDIDGKSVPADGKSIGEIALAGNTLMAGYYRDADATEKAFLGGVFRTGDLAVLHPGGQIEIRDRAKDIIISGGENISSLEVENALSSHPAVMLAAVVAKPDPKWGEVPCAFVQLKEGAQADAEELRAFCRANLAPFKVPRLFVFDELPRTATGKIQKYMLRDRAQKETL